MPASAPQVEEAALRLAPRRFSRARLWAFEAAQALGRALGGRHWYRWAYLTGARLRVREERIDWPGLDPAFDGFSIALISDLHAGPFLGPGDLAGPVERVNALAPDLVVIAGDLLTRVPEEAWLPLEDLAQLRAREGVLGVFGNHDYRGRREAEIERAYAARGIQFLRNRSVLVQRGPAALAFVGVEDLEESRSLALDLGAARAACGWIALCHNPLGAPELARLGARLVLAGHTHGHQIDLPLVRRAAPRHPGDRVELSGATLIVSRGLGALGLPLRVRAPAEIVRIVLRAGGA